MYPQYNTKLPSYSRSLSIPSGLSATWFDDLLQTGTSLFEKYNIYKNVQTQKKVAVEYNKALQEQAKFVAAQAPVTVRPKITPTVTTIAGINITYVLIGGAVLGAILLLRK